jgi:hypothetical protein
MREENSTREVYKTNLANTKQTFCELLSKLLPNFFRTVRVWFGFADFQKGILLQESRKSIAMKQKSKHRNRHKRAQQYGLPDMSRGQESQN